MKYIFSIIFGIFVCGCSLKNDTATCLSDPDVMSSTNTMFESVKDMQFKLDQTEADLKSCQSR